MKRILLIAGLTFVGAIGAFAQGSLFFTDNIFKTPPEGNSDNIFHVYSPQAGNVEVVGNSTVAYATAAKTGDFTPGVTGTVTYTGSLIGGYSTGGTTATSYANGANFDAALYAVAGTSATATAVNGGLQLVAGSVTAFNTSGNANNAGLFTEPASALSIVNSSYSGDQGPNGPNGANDPVSATVQVAAWWTDGGADTTLAQAMADPNGEWGVGNVYNVSALGGAGGPNPPNTIGFESFSLVTNVPEPTTIAFGVMGVCAFLARRKK